MINRILLVVTCAIVISSCSTAYRTGQTPDDVYLSSGRTVARPVAAGNYRNQDRDIMMEIRDPRYRTLDYAYDDYSYSPYNYGYNYDYYYNPVYYPYPVYTTSYYCTCNCYDKYDVILKAPVNTTPRMTNLSAYNGKYNNSNIVSNLKSGNLSARPAYNNTNRSSGNSLTRLFSSQGNSSRSYESSSSTRSSNNSSYDNSSSRSYTPSTSSSSSSSSSGGGGGISRPSRH